MKIQFLATRHYMALGLRNDGDEEEVDAALADQLIRQGFARKAAAPKKVERAPVVSDEED